MTITTLEGIKSSQRWRIPLRRAAGTTIASVFNSTITRGGDPAAGTLAGASTAAGILQVDSTGGYPTIPSFLGGAKGYLTGVDFISGTQLRFTLFDCLVKFGAYTFNANTAVTMPSITSRIPLNPAGSPDYTGLELWAEGVTTGTLNQSVTVTYNDEGGVSGSTGAVSAGTTIAANRRWQLPLAAGDTGVSAVTNVQGTVASAGTFNVLLMRPLFQARYVLQDVIQKWSLLEVGMPEIFDTSALDLSIFCDSTSSQQQDAYLEICSG